MLLPPDLREWVRGDDLAHFILEAVEGLAPGAACVNERGSGSEQYPPAMMMGVLLYCYAQGIFSSRRIEAATYAHVSVRYLAAPQRLRQRMTARLQSAEGRRLYPRRQSSVEPVFGMIKSVLGFRRFGLRGLEKVNLEWQLVSAAFNCRRLAARRSQRR